MFSAGIGIEQMARMLTSENATQRGSTVAAALDAIAAVSRVLSYDLLRYGVMVVEKSATLPRMALESISGKLQQGDGPGWRLLNGRVASGHIHPAGIYDRARHPQGQRSMPPLLR